MRVPRSALLALGLSLVACGSAAPPPEIAAVTIATTAPAPASPAPAPIVVGLPSNAVLTASFDGRALSSLLRMKAPGFPFEALTPLLAQLAPSLDPARPVTLALLGPTPAGQRAIATLRPLIPAAEPSRSATVAPETLHAAIADIPTTLSLRALIPTKDPAALRVALASLLERGGFKAGDGEWAHDRRRIAIYATADTLVVDLAMGQGAHAGLAALRGSSAGDLHAEAPPLEGRALRVRYKPSELADLGFLTGIAETDAALVGASIEPEQKAWIAAQGAWESAQSYALAGSAKGSYFDAIDLSLHDAEGKMELLVTADVGPALVAPPDDAWKPSTSVSLPDNIAAVDIAEAFSNAWGFPGDPGGREGGSKIINLTREAGFAGYFIALPWLLAEMPRIQLGQAARLLDDRPKDSLPFARTGFLSQAESRTFFGILPENTPRADAECVLAGKTPCSGPLKLKLGVTPLSDQRFARLILAGTRYVLYISRDKDALPGKSSLRELGPARVELSLPALAKRERLDVSGFALPDRLIGTVERTPKAIVFRLATP